MEPCARVPAAISNAAISQWDRITVRMLLKSWATPPARRPKDSIFCAWRSWAWSFSCSCSACLCDSRFAASLSSRRMADPSRARLSFIR